MAHATDRMTDFVVAMKHQGNTHACNTRLRFVWERNGRIIGLWCPHCMSIVHASLNESSALREKQTPSRSRGKNHLV